MDTIYGYGHFTINWGSNTTVAANNYARIGDADEFNDYVNRYKYWKMVGVKIRYTPLTSVTGTNSFI